MARDRDYENRMYGYISAYNKAQKEGLEAVGKDIKNRNLLKVNVAVPESKMREIYEVCSKNCYNNMLTGILYVLHDCCQFGKVRIKKVKDAFDKLVIDTMDLDYMGEHYVRLQDFAIELNEKYDIGIDINKVASCEEISDKSRSEDYHYCQVDKVIKSLKENGFADAAEFLEKKLE